MKGEESEGLNGITQGTKPVDRELPLSPLFLEEWGGRRRKEEGEEEREEWRRGRVILLMLTGLRPSLSK